MALCGPRIVALVAPRKGNQILVRGFLLSAFQRSITVAKVDDELGVVFGYAIVCNEDGEPYFDKQGDYIPEDAMLKAWLDFAAHSREARQMHADGPAGTVVGSFPLTADIAAALGIAATKTGLIIAMRPDAGMLAKFRSGELTGFSIGGARIRDEEVADAAAA